jgi:hypothetical protein
MLESHYSWITHASEEGRGSHREDRARAGARFQGRVEIELKVRGESQALEDRITVIQLRSSFRIARWLGHCFQIGPVPKDAEPAWSSLLRSNGLLQIPPHATEASIGIAVPLAPFARRKRPHFELIF